MPIRLKQSFTVCYDIVTTTMLYTAHNQSTTRRHNPQDLDLDLIELKTSELYVRKIFGFLCTEICKEIHLCCKIRCRD
jgi:hypothetical protein